MQRELKESEAEPIQQYSEFLAILILQTMRRLGAKKSTLVETREVLTKMRDAFYAEWKEELITKAKEFQQKETTNGETITNQ